ncbi:hypothetical protein C0992_010470 [Termitomyces sp. T32_za158]|nr:hypothetical protein C0992_010470 [Termitomyces sp. T32_za158]
MSRILAAQTTMDRPGPLKDLPLDHFLPDNPNLSRKRPLSSVPVLVSPAKRRILNEEGIYSPRSHLVRRNVFSDVLAGPSSPAKRLDFGPPKQSPESSRFKNLHDCFTQPSDSFVPPRKTSPKTELQSIHYPGFHVYYDPQLPSSADETSCLPASSDKDKGVAVKENIPPRRRTRKAATAPPEESKAQLLTTPAKRRVSERLKAKTTPATPKKSLTGDRMQHDSPTPRRMVPGQEAAFASRRYLDDEETTTT